VAASARRWARERRHAAPVASMSPATWPSRLEQRMPATARLQGISCAWQGGTEALPGSQLGGNPRLQRPRWNFAAQPYRPTWSKTLPLISFSVAMRSASGAAAHAALPSDRRRRAASASSSSAGEGGAGAGAATALCTGNSEGQKRCEVKEEIAQEKYRQGRPPRVHASGGASAAGTCSQRRHRQTCDHIK
jgi:hypothetical protein